MSGELHGPCKSDCAAGVRNRDVQYERHIAFGVRLPKPTADPNEAKDIPNGEIKRRERERDRDKCTSHLGSQGPLSWLTIVRACFFFFFFSGSTC